MKTLVVYYSQARGNTKRIADMIVEETGFDAVRIDTVVPYTGTYEEIVDQGQDEVERKFKPEIKPIEVDFSAYGRFIIMTPTWWYTMAPAVLSFLSGHDFSGKHLVFVQTHGGWPGQVMKDMKNATKGAIVDKEFAVRFDSAGGDKLVTDESEIKAWIKEMDAFCSDDKEQYQGSFWK